MLMKDIYLNDPFQDCLSSPSLCLQAFYSSLFMLMETTRIEITKNTKTTNTTYNHLFHMVQALTFLLPLQLPLASIGRFPLCQLLLPL